MMRIRSRMMAAVTPALTLAITLAVLGCGQHGGISSTASPTQRGASGGGVDVGNMKSADVPGTNASIGFPADWSPTATTDQLALQNGSGSKITVSHNDLKDLSSPNRLALQQYLKIKFPSRLYNTIRVNGFEGVRSDLINTATEVSSDIYLVSELKDFIHIQADLKGGSIATGQKILTLVSIRYNGIAYPPAMSKTITLRSPDAQGNGEDSSYSFLGDCFTEHGNCSQEVGAPVSYQQNFRIEGGGRIIELGPDSLVSFDSIHVDGKVLVAPLAKTPISDIYTAFQINDPQIEVDNVDLKEGYVYLIRTIRWPSEDLVTKMRVEKLYPAQQATITYQKLIYVPTAVLEKQVDDLNQNTIKNEMPIAEGEVTLFSNSVWNAPNYASFNFQYSTSGNPYITDGEWDLTYNGIFTAPSTTGGISQITDVGVRDLSSLVLSDFPDMNSRSRLPDKNGQPHTNVVVGHTYLISHYDFNDDPNADAVFGAVQVLSVGANEEWVHLKFRRVKVSAADEFQKWVSLRLPIGVQTVTLERTTSPFSTRFYPFINRRGDKGQDHNAIMEFMINDTEPTYLDDLTTDSRPYGTRSGFYKLGNGISMDGITAGDVQLLKGQLVDDIHPQTGDVYAVLLDNYFNRTIMIMKIDDYQKFKSIKLAIKYLTRARSPFSDDVN